MSNTYANILPITYQRDTFPTPISAISFDPVSDVLWAGNNSGQVAAYYRTRSRGVVYPVGNEFVSTLMTNEHHVYAMTIEGKGLGAWSKGGANKWHYRSPPHSILSSFALRSSSLVAASSNSEILIFNTSTGSVIRQVPTASPVSKLHASQSLLLSGSIDGMLRSHDLRAPMVRGTGAEHSVRAHQGGIQGIESSGNWIYTIGWSSRHGRAVPDSQVKLFDSRNLKSVSSFTFTAGPSLLNVHPEKSTTLVLTSNTGLVNVVDVLNPLSGEFYQLDMETYATSSAISPTGAYIAIGDAEGVIHMLSNVEDEFIPFNGYDGQPVEWADPPQPLPAIDWTDETPLNLIGMPYYNDYLLSSYDRGFQSVTEYYPPPEKLPSQILSSLKQVDGIAFAQMPRELQGKRNLAITPGQKRQGRFMSDKSRKGRDASPDSPTGEYRGDRIPRHYQKVEIEYSKFGIEDFDFASYNKTRYSGLETHIINSYTNPLIQTLHYVMPMRFVAISHTRNACPREHCLLCELGFVMYSIDDACGVNCQATNFGKTISNLPSAAGYGVIDYAQDGQDVDYLSKIQVFNRFLIDSLSTEGNLHPKNPDLFPKLKLTGPFPSAVTQLMGINAKTTVKCNACGNTRVKDGLTHVVDMLYPKKALPKETPLPDDFASILRNSFLQDATHKATCTFCKQVTLQRTRRLLTPGQLPGVLGLNTCVYTDEQMSFWRNPRQTPFIKPFVGIDLMTEPTEPGGVVNDTGTTSPRVVGRVWYELRSLIIQVKSSERRSHLIAIVKIPQVDRIHTDPSPWILFNDFTARVVPEEEALSFAAQWKVPAILYFERVDMEDTISLKVLPMELNKEILITDTSLSPLRSKARMAHEILSPEEIPEKSGFLVAIDAEFVQMQQEEIEYYNDGRKRIVRPARLSLARVSVIRGTGPKAGIPFIDDYIHTSETIVDYLTEFSGIQPGDLNPHTSPHTLVPLKVAYKKLRLLVDLGCIFVGHGLSKDFRMINIFVSPEQRRDTVDFYYIHARHRRLSLRFLSWYILGDDIQQETHDSIEDAKSALELYRAFQFLGEDSNKKVEELYKAGRDYNWKPPIIGTISPPVSNRLGSTSPPYSHMSGVSPPIQSSYQAFGLDPSKRGPLGYSSPMPVAMIPQVGPSPAPVRVPTEFKLENHTGFIPSPGWRYLQPKITL